MERDRDLLLDAMDEAFDRKSWHGPNLRGALRGVTAEQAAWRPGPERHNIWEVAVHAAYWKYVARRRLTGEKRGGFPLRGSNWFHRPEKTSEQAWPGDLALLVDEHRKLRETVAALPPAVLRGEPRGAKLRLIRGVATHDVYHAGQIQLLKRLCPDGRRS